MADDEKKTASPPESGEAKAPVAPAKKSSAKAPAKSEVGEKTTEKAPEKKKSDAKPAPRRPKLDPESARLLWVRSDLGGRRPKFVRQATHRYFRIGRWASWRRPRGLQSKQRRHYGYRSKIVRIGYGGPKRTRGLTPTGFRPVIVRTEDEIRAIDPIREAVVIARTVGTRRRLVLEESCRRLGLHILNPIVKEREER
jgi:large subunit ribosomal protein L32e